MEAVILLLLRRTSKYIRKRFPEGKTAFWSRFQYSSRLQVAPASKKIVYISISREHLSGRKRADKRDRIDKEKRQQFIKIERGSPIFTRPGR
jgi:hypothetical protein